MTFKTYEINVDLVHDTSTTYSNHFSQNDRNSAKLLVTITNKGAELDLSQAKSVRMSFRKPDGTRVFQNDCQPINAMKGKYQIVLKTQTLTSVGNVIAQIHIEEEDRILDTQKFFFVVNDSLASDEAVESTNEFTIIQKAIEAGKKLEGVDINGIIAAGELAKGALPKSGGTMTGILDINNNVSFGFKAASGTRAFDFYTASSNIFNFRHVLLNKNIFTVDGNGVFNVITDTNLLKTTGGTVTGNLVMSNAAAEINFKDDKSEVAIQKTSSGAVAMWDRVNQTIVWQYFPTTKEFRVPTETNLLKKTGDTMTGDILVDRNNAATNRNIVYTTGGVRDVSLGQNTSGKFLAWDQAGNNGIWEYEKATKTFNVTAPNTNLVTKTKDGRATLTLTENATQYGSTYTPIATRRGNTVTLRMVVSRNGNDSGVITTLPVDMRPVDGITSTILASDGTSSDLVIRLNGEVEILTKNKTYRISLTYVVD
ncbi:BppU family phage baseplate upper protein [Bacillus paranthracis]|uniref:BppU family phage baseplate upper protein n=1 Tax=Bacillus paranthracis TaxID=2026186 RepID=UPI001E4809AA|nr:BppU family phage baseplate upper protein [Bacillus paranthracis]MCC2502474.1 phage baseplate upper protein [Bacillus paranthracis]MDF9577745.1 BppU family phage baseplate upper protein [Bacillus paranthracis]MDG1614912.1 BppU family phage baseplate upper protein [Bacillus paranthracis]